MRDIGLKGSKDDLIFRWAQENSCTILSGDLGFGNLLRFPLGTHKGVVIAKFPNEIPIEKMNRILIDAIVTVREEIIDNLIIIEPDKIRIRRK